jgi:hypothetical protein
LARANKAEKALSDANKEHIQWEQAVIEWLNKMSALAGGEYHAFPFFVELPALMLADVCFFLCLCFLGCVEHTGCLHHLCSQTMILLWPQLTCWRQTRFLSRRSSSWLAARSHRFSSGCGPSRERRCQILT